MAKPSKRDEAFDALTAVCGINADELTKSARGQVNAALKAIREASPNVTAEEFHERADEYGRRFNVALTPSSLAKHWPSLGTRQPKGAREKVVAQFGQHYTSWGTPR